MTHSVDTSQPLFMTSFVILTQWAHEQSGHDDRNGGMPELINMDFHSSRPSLLGQLLSFQSDSSRDQNWVPSPHLSLGWSDSYLRQVYYIRALPSWKGQCSVLIGRDTEFGCGFAFPACNASACYLGTYRMLYPPSWFYDYPPSWFSSEHCF